MRRFKLLLILLICCLGMAVWLSHANKVDIPNDVVRVHILANSDDAVDQAAKLCVRDAVLAQIADEMAQLQDAQHAQQWLENHTQQITEIANDALIKLGRGYKARASVGISEFPQREYAGKVYAAGRYSALKLVLGEGAGQNWWCVAFPPLCINDFTRADISSTNMDKLQGLAETKDVPIQFRSAVWEWFLQVTKGE